MEEKTKTNGFRSSFSQIGGVQLNLPNRKIQIEDTIFNIVISGVRNRSLTKKLESCTAIFLYYEQTGYVKRVFRQILRI